MSIHGNILPEFHIFQELFGLDFRFALEPASLDPRVASQA